MTDIKDWNLKKYYTILIIFVCVINITLIFNNNVWCDEAFILNACRLENFRDLFQCIFKEDMRPPLYLIGAKIFTEIFGLSVPILKIFSIIPTILTMILGATKIHENWGRGKAYVSTAFILLVGLSPMSITKNIEVTIYSWAFFWVISTVVYAYNVYFDSGSRKKWGALIVTALGAAATHYYGVLAEILIFFCLYIALLHKSRYLIKKCVIVSIITIIGYVPILPFFFYQFSVARKSFWITDVSLFTILQSMRAPFEGENAFRFTNEFTMIFWGFVIGALLNYVILICKRRLQRKPQCAEDIFCVMCGIIFMAFAIIGVILSKVIRPLYVDRYIYVVVGILWLFIAISIERFAENTKQKCVCLGVICCMCIFTFPTVWDREYNMSTIETVNYLKDNISSDDIFINNIEQCANWEVEYYFPQNKCYLNCDQDIYYKNESFDFSTLDTTAWYLCSGDFDISQEILERYNLQCEWMRDGDFDRYYYFSIYKISPKK